MFLEHVNLTVSDLDRSEAFYGHLLGLDVRWRGLVSEGRRALHIGDEHCYLALFEAATPGKEYRDYTQIGINHFGFVVDDLDETRRRIRETGAEVHFEADYEPGLRIYLYDPDGNEVELVSYVVARQHETAAGRAGPANAA